MKVNKAYEITNAKIQFVSLVDKAANLKKFLITKAADGQATFSTYGRIIQKDAEHHFVTGIVYEPMAEDAHGNFMTEEEITKAAYYFTKSGSKVDLQHSFEPLPGAVVVESWIAKADFKIGDEPVQKGTWLMTVELSDESLWEAIEKGEITGFSMGGVGNYSEEDVQLEDVNKNAPGSEPEQSEKKGLFKKLAEMFGFDVVEKGAMSEEYARRSRSSSFWTAFSTLQDTLSHYDYYTEKQWYETDETKIREALTEFSSIVEDILTSSEPIAKAIAKDEPVLKVGKKMSGKNRETLQGIYETLGTFLAAFDPSEEEEPTDDKEKPPKPAEGDEGDEDKDNDKEDKDVTKAEVEKLVQESVTAAVAKALGVDAPETGDESITTEAVQKMVEEAVAKAITPAQPEDEPVTAESVAKMVEEAVSKAVEPVLKARGVPTAINDGGSGDTKPVEKHYLHGIL